MINKEIPKGLYCYDENGICPHWSIDPSLPEQMNGCCSYLKINDSESPGFGLLWDQCKECSVNLDEETN